MTDFVAVKELLSRKNGLKKTTVKVLFLASLFTTNQFEILQKKLLVVKIKLFIVSG